ncbi:hypothetical protein WL19_15725 [Burkholderia ubonensis]|nr:hypothetical protein WL19_15725 [Burkholderia ubonensis]
MPLGLKSHDAKLDRVLICAIVRPFDAGSCMPATGALCALAAVSLSQQAFVAIVLVLMRS